MRADHPPISDRSGVTRESRMYRKTALLLYDSRSGSTLLAALLNRHADVAVSPESAYITRLMEYSGGWGASVDRERLLDHLFAEIQFAEMLSRADVTAAFAAANGYESPAAAMRVISDAYFRRADPDAAVRIIKHPPWNYLPQVEWIFPAVHYIHIVRDVRAVYASKRKTRSLDGEVMERNVVKAARDWRRCLSLARTAARLHELRYEDLLRDPDTEINKILDFLKVKKSGRRQTKAQWAYAASIGSRQQQLHANVAREPDRTHASRWTEDLTPVEIAVFERLCARELARFGYDRATSRVSNAKLAGAIAVYAAHLLADKPRRLWRRVRAGEHLASIVVRRYRRWRRRAPVHGV